MLSSSEENYLKVLLLITNGGAGSAGTNELAAHMDVKPATANDMLKKLREKKLVHYEKYEKTTLTSIGRKYAVDVLRKHRLWETFLCEKLGFTWDEVHEVAEQLEHVQSKKLIDKLDDFLHHPKFDPHGDVIPNNRGSITIPFKKTLADVSAGQRCKMVAVKDDSVSFLKHVVRVGLAINSPIKVTAKDEYEDSMQIETNGRQVNVTGEFAENIYVACKNCVPGKPCSRNRCLIK